jgi:hypothetical protein
VTEFRIRGADFYEVCSPVLFAALNITVDLMITRSVGFEVAYLPTS